MLNLHLFDALVNEKRGRFWRRFSEYHRETKEIGYKNSIFPKRKQNYVGWGQNLLNSQAGFSKMHKRAMLEWHKLRRLLLDKFTISKKYPR